MRYSGIFIILVLFGSIVYSQNASKIDSLKRELKHSGSKSKIYNELATQYMRISPYECMNYAKQAFYWATKEGDEIQTAEATKLKAWAYGLYNDYDKSSMVADSALFLFKKIKNYEKVIECQSIKASVLMLQGKYNEAIEMFNTCSEEAKKLKATQLYAAMQIQKGRIQRVRGNYESALACFEDALKIIEKTKNNVLLANVYHHIGLVYQDKQNLKMAIEYHIKALPLFEQENALTQLPYVYISLGSAYRDSKNYSESLKYLRKASEYLTSLNDRWGLYELNRNIGMTYMELNKLDSAKIHFQYSLNYCREINEKAGECDNLKFLGEILLMQKEYEKSIAYLQEALKLNAQINNKLELTNILYNLGRANVYKGHYREGLPLLKRSLALADSLDVIYEKMIIHKELSTAFLKLNQPREALKHFEIYSTLKDSIYKTESNRHFVEMEQKYQSEKQKQEIGQLKIDKIEQDIAIRKQRSARNIFILGFLFASLTGFLFYRSFRIRKKADMEKEALLKEIHHRVKNNLQVVSSLLNIQSEYITDNKIIDVVHENQGRVKAMALIHQLLYQGDKFTRIDFNEYLTQLTKTLSNIYQPAGSKIDTHIVAEKVTFDIDTSIPLGLIITELVSNAYKYAFNDSKTGIIQIGLQSVAPKGYELTVSDNGKGLPDNINIENNNSMGLKLVRLLTEQIDGQFKAQNNNGALFTISFSENY